MSDFSVTERKELNSISDSLLQMITELMTEILKNLFGKCGNRMISHENAPGMDSYVSAHLRKDAQTHLL